MRAHEPRLRDVFARHRRRTVAAVALLLLTMLAGAALLGVSGHFLTGAALAGTTALGFNFFGPSAGIRALTFVRILSRYAEKLVGHDATLRIARDLRVWFFRGALPRAPLALGRYRVGELVTRLLADIEAVDGRLVRGMGPLLAVLALCVLAAGITAWCLPAAGAVLLATLLLLGVLAPAWSVRCARAQEQARAEARMHLRASVQEGIEGLADLVAMEGTPAWLQALDARSRAVAREEGLRRQRIAHGTLLQAIVAAFALPALLWLLLSAVGTGRLDAALAGGLFFMAVAVLDACTAIVPAWQAWHAARVAARRLEDVVGGAATDAGTGSALPAARGALMLRNVVFAWPGTPRRVLDGANLCIAPGEHVLIAGDSGAGKSSLATLVLGLNRPQSGEVAFDGADLRTFALDDWHARIAWLPQDAPVFSGSVRDNLLLGDPAADDARLWAMLAQVRLEERFRASPDGLDTWVGENGATLSAGQARRLALARTLLRDAPLLLLDEPTEGLDQDTAETLMRDFAEAARGRSALVISHATLPHGVEHARYRLRDGRLEREGRPAPA